MMTDQMQLLFCGKAYPEEVLKQYPVDIDWMMKTESFCDNCTSLDDCKLPSPGWQLYFDEKAAGMYNKPSFRAKHCNHWKDREVKQQQEIFIAPRFQKRSFETFKLNNDNKEAYDFCYTYATTLTKDTSTGIILIGPEGVGKTHLAAAVLRTAFQRGIPGAFLVVPNLLEEIRQSYKDREAIPANAINLAAEKRLIVLDDLGAEKATDWVREQLYRIINARYEYMLPTIFTSNRSIQELEARIGLPAVGRLVEMCKVLMIKGRSWRRKGG